MSPKGKFLRFLAVFILLAILLSLRNIYKITTKKIVVGSPLAPPVVKKRIIGDSLASQVKKKTKASIFGMDEITRFSNGWADSGNERFLNYIRSRWLVAPSHGHYNLTNNQHKHFSQVGQSELVDQILHQKTEGFFVESGAADGVRFSNSLFFERERSWTGLLIEANPTLFENLTKTNRKAYTINSCLSTRNSSQQVSFKMAGFLSGIADKMDSKWVEDVTHSKYQTITAQCFTLHSLLLAVGQTEVDYFSLDVEGPELEILQTIPFDKIKIKVFSVEYRVHISLEKIHKRMSLKKLETICNFFRNLGNYREAGILPKRDDKHEEEAQGLDIIFVRI